VLPYVLGVYAVLLFLGGILLIVMMMGAMFADAGDAGLRRIVPWFIRRYGDKDAA
jgi:hypothetical protein